MALLVSLVHGATLRPRGRRAWQHGAMKQQHQAPGAPEPAHDEANASYELRQDGRVVALARYHREDDAVVFTHTEVDAALEGQGLGSRLAAYALDDVRRRGLKALPKCSFIAGYIARHEKEYGPLVKR
ncbi:GNAT family N-acetyltransferase [Ramlibacter sp. AN1133]|uniref:GNAT family N-acetyltransferase n=1 Tax=Ramlibacter sp. AN1133 TaxID=3133429 RepID=UPI0030C0AADA